MLESVIVEMRPGAFQEHRVGVVVRKSVPLKCLFSVQLIVEVETSGYLDLVQRLEFGVDHLQKNAVYQIE